MLDFEKLGAFYLGREFDLVNRQLRDDLLLYDSKDLTTHAVCVGMTGSGKTGLCLSLLEEAVIDGVPAIAIDPKGDLGNLLLAFPELKPEDFLPWIDPSAAARAGQTPEEYAAETARRWKEGLAQWGQQPDRIARYRESADIAIYTPGSTAGLPLTPLRSFHAPPPAVRDDGDLLRERITSAVSGLLGLIGVDADPVRSREHILLSNLLAMAWQQGRNLSVADLIREVQAPPISTVGVVDLETFFPTKDRAALALALNNLLASPTFAGWMSGEPLDIQRLLYTSTGQPRLSIISIAHLSDAERMFFVTLLLNEVLAWVRTQAGTSSLRALLYMDEIQGYFPPVANPPSKPPMLTLLKQARAFGLGVVLATQNPVDLDYKGLSNTGTWFIGRLQTERDKARVLEGLEGASAQAGAAFNRQEMEKTLAALGQRVFLMNNVHEDRPVIFQTRWALSYLRGPLTRNQIRELTEQRLARTGKQPETPVATPPASEPAAASKAAEPTDVLLPDDLFASSTSGPAAVGAVTSAPQATTPPPQAHPAAFAAAPGATPGGMRPILPAEAGECFLAANPGTQSGNKRAYRAGLLAKARVHYVSATHQIDHWEELTLLRPLPGNELPEALWDEARALEPEKLQLTDQPVAGATFESPPAEMLRAKSYSTFGTKLKDFLYQSRTLTVLRSNDLKLTSQPGESERDFRARAAQAAREHRDEAKEKLQARYASKLEALQNKIHTAEARVAREKSELRDASLATTVSLGESILGSLFGRKLFSRTNLSKVSRTARTAGKAKQQHADVAQAEAALARLQAERAELNNKLEEELAKIAQEYHPDRLKLETVAIRPRKSDIKVEAVRLVWVPVAAS